MSETNLEDSDVPVHTQILSTWDVGNERRLEDALTINLGYDESGFGNVSFETCVHLVSPKNASSPCEVKVTVPSTHIHMKIIQMSIMSESRVIELYGRCGEYITTIEASFIDECEEMPVYKAEMKLSQPSCECLFKFVRSKRKRDMWLYGINIQLQRNEAPNQPETAINFQNVNTILQESGHQLTEKADKCKKFLQLYRYTLDANKPKIPNKPDLQMLMKMFESKYLHRYNPFVSEEKDVPRPKCITDELLPEVTVPSIVEAPAVGIEQTNIESLVTEALIKSNLKNDVQHHVEQCFRNLEAKLMAKVEERMHELERKQSEKFDFILLQLEKLQSNMVGLGFTDNSLRSTQSEK